MKWIKASERLPEQEKEYCLRWADTKEPLTSMFSKKHGFEMIFGFHNTDVEWLDEESNVSSQEPDTTASKEIGEPLVQNNSEVAIWNAACRSTLAAISEAFLDKVNQSKGDRLGDKEVFQAIGETIKDFPIPLYNNSVQNNSIDDDDFEEDPDPNCEACGYNHGNHMKGCPNDDSPFALLCRRGFD